LNCTFLTPSYVEPPQMLASEVLGRQLWSCDQQEAQDYPTGYRL